MFSTAYFVVLRLQKPKHRIKNKNKPSRTLLVWVLSLNGSRKYKMWTCQSSFEKFLKKNPFKKFSFSPVTTKISVFLFLFSVSKVWNILWEIKSHLNFALLDSFCFLVCAHSFVPSLVCSRWAARSPKTSSSSSGIGKLYSIQFGFFFFNECSV